MGGRSKKGHQLTDRWKWIEELSEERLNNYGRYSQIETDQHRAAGLSDSQSSLARGREASAADLNFQLSKYYELKYGVKPDWSVKKRRNFAKIQTKTASNFFQSITQAIVL